MMQRTTRDAVAAAFAALNAGRFGEARDLAAPFRTADGAAALLHALGEAGSGGAERAAPTLEAIARANRGSRHPALDAADLLLRAFRAADAAVLLRLSLALRPDDPALWTALGAALSEDGTGTEMVECFRRAAALRGSAADWSNLGKALAAGGDPFDEAFGRAATLAPDDPQLRLNHAVALLRAGRAEGWAPFRSRHALPNRRPPPPGPELRTPGKARGRPVVLLHDEGYGDTFHFIRYAPLLEAVGAEISVLAPPPLHRLLAQSGLRLAPTLPEGATWCRIPDLPSVFAGQPVPPPLPFRADPSAVARAGARLGPRGGAKRMAGLVWAGASRRHDPDAVLTDRTRSLRPDALGPLLAVPGVRWVSLQQGAEPPPGVVDGLAGAADWADTAAVIANLDLVVSVDTAVAHLAASMGRPVLLLDRFDHCWRWRPGEERTEWYDSVRVVRQDRPGGWDAVLLRAAALLDGGDWT